MSKLISMRHSSSKTENNECSCEACGRVYENAIKLTNLSTVPMQTYSACPFCFSRLEEVTIDEPTPLESPVAQDSIQIEREPKNTEAPEHIKCPHHFGYLKTRPKDTPIPDACLTCQKMIQCLF